MNLQRRRGASCLSLENVKNETSVSVSRGEILRLLLPGSILQYSNYGSREMQAEIFHITVHDIGNQKTRDALWMIDLTFPRRLFHYITNT